MIKQIALFTLIATALMATPAIMRAQDQPSQIPVAAQKSAPAAKKHRHLPFHGKIAKVDMTAKTVTVGHTVLHVSSQTRITQNGKPATASDLAVGEKISGSYVKDEDGTHNALLIHIHVKSKGAGKIQKVEKSEASE